MEQKELIEDMCKDLNAYKVDNSSAKPLFTTMKEISEWLKEKEQ